jgi:hypothetical protein
MAPLTMECAHSVVLPTVDAASSKSMTTYCRTWVVYSCCTSAFVEWPGTACPMKPRTTHDEACEGRCMTLQAKHRARDLNSKAFAYLNSLPQSNTRHHQSNTRHHRMSVATPIVAAVTRQGVPTARRLHSTCVQLLLLSLSHAAGKMPKPNCFTTRPGSHLPAHHGLNMLAAERKRRLCCSCKVLLALPISIHDVNLP